MNNRKGFEDSKNLDAALVYRLVENGFKQSRLASVDEDTKQFWDILVKKDGFELRIDTKYPKKVRNLPNGKKEIWVEFTKLCGVNPGKADDIWYFIKDGNNCIKIFLDKKTLINFLVSKKDRKLTKSKSCKEDKNCGDMIAWIDIDELDKISITKKRIKWIQKRKH